MKQLFSKIMLLAVLALAVCACDSENKPDPKQKVDYDKMVGDWNVSSYTVKWINLDNDATLKDIALDNGTLAVTKRTEGGDTYFYYTEDFINENRTEYSGRFDISETSIELRNSEGFLRDDGAESYEFVVSCPAENQMQWVCEWTGTRSINGVPHQEKRSVKAVFNKK